jgi:hypothetical protein
MTYEKFHDRQYVILPRQRFSLLLLLPFSFSFSLGKLNFISLDWTSILISSYFELFAGRSTSRHYRRRCKVPLSA